MQVNTGFDDTVKKRKFIFFDWRAYTHTYAKLGVFLMTLVFFAAANYCFAMWNRPDLREASQRGELLSSRLMLALGLLASGLTFVTPMFGERVGVIPYVRFKSYLCAYRLSFVFMLFALVLCVFGWGRYMAMGRMAKLRCGARACPMDCCVMMEALVEDKWGFGDYFRAIDGYVAIEQTRVVAHTKEVHNVTEGDELYVSMMQTRDTAGPRPTMVQVGNTSTAVFFQQEEVTRWAPPPNAPTRYHQIPPPWLTFETRELTDVLQTVTVAPIFQIGEVCLERPPPTNQVCLKRNEIIGFAVKFGTGVCRLIGSTTCTVDWEMMQLKPSYKCDANMKYDQEGQDVNLQRFDSGLCGRIIQPHGQNQVLLREALKRFTADGWAFPSPVSLNPNVLDESTLLLVDVEEDPCISGAEECISHFREVGNAGIALSAISAFLVVLAALLDVYHDFLTRQITLIDQKELNMQRKIRKATEMERLRTLEAMQLEQKLQMEELDAMGKVDVRQNRPAEDDEYARMFAPLPPGAAPPV